MKQGLASRNTLHELFVSLPTELLVVYADRNDVRVARTRSGDVYRLGTIARLLDTLAPLPELHGP